MKNLYRPELLADPEFVACALATIDAEGMLEEFDRLFDTTLVSRKSPIERMIDKATGKLDTDMLKLMHFVAEYVYLPLCHDHGVEPACQST